MKYQIWLIVILRMTIFCWAEGTQVSCDWIRLPIREKAADDWEAFPEADIYEVVHSKFELAIDRLSKEQYVPIEEIVARYFTGKYFKHFPKKKSYLVRAVYGHGGTGSYTVSRHGNDLLIEHSSLGHEVIYHKSALLLNLDFTPEQVYIACSIGR